MSDGAKGILPPTAGGLGSTTYENFIATFPIEDGEHPIAEVKEVKRPCYPTLLVKYSPLRAIRGEMIMLNKYLKV